MRFITIYEWTEPQDVPFLSAEQLAEIHEVYNTDRGCILELDDNNSFVKVVGCGGGEPEDNTLCRDYDWVEKELNRLAGIINKQNIYITSLINELDGTHLD